MRPRKPLLHPRIKYIQKTIERVDHEGNFVQLSDGNHLPYDVLVVATGTRTVPEDFISDLEGIITVGDFYGVAAGGQIIFT